MERRGYRRGKGRRKVRKGSRVPTSKGWGWEGEEN